MNLLSQTPEIIAAMIVGTNEIEYSTEQKALLHQWIYETIFNYHCLLCSMQGYMYPNFDEDGEVEIVIDKDQVDLINKVKLAVEIANMLPGQDTTEPSETP